MKAQNQKLYRIMFRRRIIVSMLIILQIVLFIALVLDASKYSKYVSIALNLMSIVVAVGIMLKPSNSAYKTSWIFLILIFPVFGGLLYLFITTQSSTRLFTKKLAELGMQAKDLFKIPTSCSSKAENDVKKYASLIRYLENQSFPSYENTYVKYLTPGEEKLKYLLEEIEKAEKYIFLEYFIIQEGYMWNEIYTVLKRKVDEGIDVRIIYDDMGCFFLLPADFAKKLNEDGIKCVVFNKFRPFLSAMQNNRDHRKIAVIDGKTAFTGGINIADEYINKIEKHGHWKDASVMIKGDAAWSFTLMFLQMWGICTSKSENYLDFFPDDLKRNEYEKSGYVIPYADSPMDDENICANVYLNIINNASDYVYINTPYLIIDECMNTALKNAAKSGVDVRIVTPHVWDKRFVHFTTRSYYGELISAGVKIYEYEKGFMHSKTFVSDDAIATVGTANLDYRSLFLHFECGACVFNEETVEEIKEDFIKNLDKCININENSVKNNLFIRVMQSIYRLLAPLM